MRNKLIIHGHFYQPPREDPWTGLIPVQKSAAPYSNWNHRIARECYAANAFSRILDNRGLILDIVNNYQYISFNFGPTLLSWLKDFSPGVYGRIIEADRQSLKCNKGHGNAIAQSYNHSILPLCSTEEARTQIIWCLRHFEFHFGRSSEGLWLPEAAVNNSILDLLIKEGVKFIILSPWQAGAYSPKPSTSWKALADKPIPSHRVYEINRPEGSIAVFFYNHSLASGISFSHYLHNADSLYTQIRSFKSSDPVENLISIATDGEIYGHHEPFGDMCLAALIRLIEKRDDFQLTNYGLYLEEQPPRFLVRLKGGEDNLGTSWSCSHGVSRWYKDCGCTDGGKEGWKQRWRKPLRESLNKLRGKLEKVYSLEMKRISSFDPLALRNHYIEVIEGRRSRKEFAAGFLDKIKQQDHNSEALFFNLLEGQKYAMFMFTSCGWFFSDLSGIETIQNLAYAARAIELYSPFTGKELVESFLESIGSAHSNIAEQGSGKELVEKNVFPMRKGLEYGAALFIIAELYKLEERRLKNYGFFEKEELVFSRNPDNGNGVEHSGNIRVISSLNGRSEAFSFHIFVEPGKLPRLSLDQEKKGKRYIELNTLPQSIKASIIQQLTVNCLKECGDLALSIFNHHRDLLSISRSMSLPLPEEIINMAAISLKSSIEKIISNNSAFSDKETLMISLKEIEKLIALAREFEIAIDLTFLNAGISKLVAQRAENLSTAFKEHIIEEIKLLAKSAGRMNLTIDLARAQNSIFQLLMLADRQDYLTPHQKKLLTATAFVVGINA
ncbi:MAG TPA: DUF3536 domain-containing protein [Spirochaetales bacterium]|nr:DUF3536 domain-containing protein [Spirochaetales bacterium]